MTPRELGSAAIRNLPGEPPHERKQHGPITDLVRHDRCGVTAYEGRCDGELVGIVEIRHGHWTARNTSGALVREGTLVWVLVPRVPAAWMSPDGNRWDLVRDAHGDVVELMRAAGSILYRAEGPLSAFLADGWRPVREQ